MNIIVYDMFKQLLDETKWAAIISIFIMEETTTWFINKNNTQIFEENLFTKN